MPPTAIVVAVEEELRAIRKRMPRAEMISAGGVSFFRGELAGAKVVLAKSGMGSDRAYRTTKAIVEAALPDEIIIAGFCAGMRPNITPGDLVVALEAASLEDYSQTSKTPDALIGSSTAMLTRRAATPLVDEAKQIKLSDVELHFGTIVSSSRVLRTAVDKQRLGLGPDVVAIDMESAGAVAAANGADLPWLVVRAVTDGLADDLPLDFEQFIDASGEVNRSQIATYVAMRPWLAPALVRLGKRSALAARNLGAFLEALLARRRLARIVPGGVE